MYSGYAGYGSVEVFNVARLVKYASEGAAPPDVTIDPGVGDYADLPSALGDSAYRTPLLDNAPWYDETNPDSAYFAGVLPLEITGLNGTTRGRTVIEKISNGGTASAPRSGSRTIAVTALAIAADEASLGAGLDWLDGALHPPCATDLTSCAGAPLALFSAAPVHCDHIADEDADLEVTQLLPAPTTVSQYGPGLAFQDVYGTLLPPTCSQTTVTASVRLADATPMAQIIGKVVVMNLVDQAGTVYATIQEDLPSDGSAVVVETTVEPSAGFDAYWQPVLRWYDAAIIDGGGVVPEDDTGMIDSGGVSPVTTSLIDGVDPDGPWGVGAGDSSLLTVNTWTYTHQPELTVDQCLADLRRSYRNVVTVDGPRVVEELALVDGTPWAAKVEWTWVATDPLPYGDTTDLVRGLYVDKQGYSGITHHADLFAQFPMPIAAPAGPVIVDGVAVTAGTRVLFGAQTIPAQNGIRVYQGPGAPWIRAADMNTWEEALDSLVYIDAGVFYASIVYGATISPGGEIDHDPIPFLPEAPIVAPYDDTVVWRADGVQISDNDDVSGVDTECPVPAPVLVLCGDDPDLPVILAPPAAPSIPDVGMGEPPTYYTRRTIQVPPDLSPQPGGALTVMIRNMSEAPYRRVRFRLYPDPDPDFGVDEECGFEQEFWLTYIAGEQTVTIDGPNQRVTTTCESGVDADHERSMRGAYGGPFTFPVLRCGERYHIAIDVPAASSEDRGLAIDLSVTRQGV